MAVVTVIAKKIGGKGYISREITSPQRQFQINVNVSVDTTMVDNQFRRLKQEMQLGLMTRREALRITDLGSA